MDTEHTIEKRVSDMEAVINDIPHILNLRLERFDTSFYENAKRFDEVNARLNLIDKQFNMLTSDMRDLRSGVTRQLIAQDKAIAELRTEVQVFKTMTEGQLTQLLDRAARIEMAQAELKTGIDKKLDNMSARFEDRIARMEMEQAGFRSSVEARLASLESKLDLILAKLSK